MRALLIRRGNSSDFEPLLDLFEAVAEERIWIGTEPDFDRDRYRERWIHNLAAPNRPLFVACDGERVIGMLAVNEHEEFGPTLGMLVEAAFRGQGVGQALLDACIAWARERGLPALHLLVFPHNTRARALYRRKGFIEVERFERDVTRSDGQVWDSILMSLRLR
ncbi:MAG: GNAT family N-acetyltransferase [Vulcanimicrobiaceae bacterium]